MELSTGLDRVSRSAVMTALVFGIAQASALADDEVTLAASQDNTMFAESDDLSNGAGSRLFAGVTAMNDARRALLSFDIAAAVPEGATITEATLRLYMSKTATSAKDVSLYRLLAAWGEGTSDAPDQEGTGAPASIGDATWAHTFYDTDFWTIPGGEYVPTPSAVQSVGGLGFYEWGSTAELVADVQLWLDDPSSNYGWIVIGDESGPKTAKRFDSRENPAEANRPALIVQYVLVDCPADITGDALVDVLDLLEVLSQWGGSGTADITGDGLVDVLDLLEVLGAWGPCE